MVQMKEDINGWFETSYRKNEGNSNMHTLLWWPGKSLPWLWEGSLRPSSLYCLPECACQRDPLPCQTQGPPICTDGLRGHPVLHWISPAQTGSESQWSHTNEGNFFQWPVCASSVVTDSHFFPSVLHTPLHSATFWFLDILEKDSATSLVLQLHQFLSIFPLFVRLVKKLFGKVLQSYVIVVKVVGHAQ